MKRWVENSLKVIISLGLIIYLVSEADPRKILEIFRRITTLRGMFLLVSAFLLTFAAIYLMSLRWKILLKGYGLRLSLSRLYGFYLVGLFFNNFLPTSIGGDVVRIYKVVNEIEDRSVGFASVIIERIMGIAATLFMAIIALFLISQEFKSPRLLYTSISLFVLISLFFLVIIRNRPFMLLLRFFDKFTIFKIGEKLNKLLEAIHYFKDRRRILAYVFIFSLMSQSAIVFMNYMLARAFDVDVSLSMLFMVIPVSFVLTMLPSINGLGVRDLGFVSLLGRVGISKAGALSLSFMNLLIPMTISIWGAVLFVIQKKKTREGEIDVVRSTF